MTTFTIYSPATTKDIVVQSDGLIHLRRKVMAGKIGISKKIGGIFFAGDVSGDNISNTVLEKSLLGQMYYYSKDVGWIWVSKYTAPYTVNKDGTIVPLTKEKKELILRKRK